MEKEIKIIEKEINKAIDEGKFEVVIKIERILHREIIEGLRRMKYYVNIMDYSFDGTILYISWDR